MELWEGTRLYSKIEALSTIKLLEGARPIDDRRCSVWLDCCGSIIVAAAPASSSHHGMSSVLLLRPVRVGEVDDEPEQLLLPRPRSEGGKDGDMV